MKTIRKGTAGKATLRLVQTEKEFVGLVIEGGKTLFQTRGQDADTVWSALQAELSRGGSNWFGHAGARSRFLHWFAGGFHSPAYLKNERDYKLRAKERLEQTTPVEAAITGSGHGEAVLTAYRATNLLYPIEKTRLQKLLRGPDADSFVRAAARFAVSDGVGPEAKAALTTMERLLIPHDNAKWTVVTYLPFLWRPESHIFLKPEVTKDFASRVMHRLADDYEAGLNPRVYGSLLDMAEGIRAAFANLEPRDMIDIQSVIWVVGDYRDGREQPQQ
ncbi:hypothetical protein Q9Q95_21010 [Sphingomonas sp. DG1-23]|uniref:hypothetical protein n=1 Tax=Sphingomonas sp. DG1-23 TaxID=3068316 RepID=UPI00273E1B8E|nr:hypothetical protein [Sphingomonas sp. DG1-23]MDP5281419.1 hypothetical protein [Sphingomonas sp. DG1-23]